MDIAHARTPLLAIALWLARAGLCLVVVLLGVVAIVAVTTVSVAVRLTITITLVVCRNIFRTFPA